MFGKVVKVDAKTRLNRYVMRKQWHWLYHVSIPAKRLITDIDAKGKAKWHLFSFAHFQHKFARVKSQGSTQPLNLFFLMNCWPVKPDLNLLKKLIVWKVCQPLNQVQDNCPLDYGQNANVADNQICWFCISWLKKPQSCEANKSDPNPTR